MSEKKENYFLIGIKGTGMSHLALFLKANNKNVSGCDSSEVFSTDSILKKAKINIINDFKKKEKDIDIVIYSTAFNNIELVKYYKESDKKIYSYPEYIAYLTKTRKAYGIAGTHGKTTTTALTSYLLKTVTKGEFSFFSIFGSSIINENPIIYQGNDNFVFEACEYQDHFLKYEYNGLVVTNIELDHLDYFPELNSLIQSFHKLVGRIRTGGFLLCCGDDKNSFELAQWASENRKDIIISTYGFKKHNTFIIEKMPFSDNKYCINLDLSIPLKFPYFQEELINNCLASVFLATFIILDRKNPKLYLDEKLIISSEILNSEVFSLLKNINLFPGVYGREEINFSKAGIIYMEDYAHHPKEIEVTISNLRKKYPAKHIFLIFFPHTYSRTKGLYQQFLKAFNKADYLFLYKTFSSARGDEIPKNEEDISQTLAKEINISVIRNPLGKLQAAYYSDNKEILASLVASALIQDSLCISMGAGNHLNINKRISELRSNSK